MATKRRFPGGAARGRQRASDHLRTSACRRLREYYDGGYLDDDEYRRRCGAVETAVWTDEVERHFDDLPTLDAGRWGSAADRARASDHEREAALRDLAVHRDAGRLADADYQRRVDIVRQAKARFELDEAFVGLPKIGPRRESRAQHFASDDERDAAIAKLNRHLGDARLTVDEHRDRVDHVRASRTHEHIREAFAGLDDGTTPRTIRNKATELGGVAAVGASKVLGIAIKVAWAVVSAIIVVIWQVTGIGAVVPVVILALMALIATVLLRVPRALSGDRSSRR